MHAHNPRARKPNYKIVSCKACSACTQCSGFCFHCSGRDLNAFPAPESPCGNTGASPLFILLDIHFCSRSLAPPPPPPLGRGSAHAHAWCGCTSAPFSYLFCRRHQCRGRWAPPRPLLRGSCRNPLQYNPATKDANVTKKKKKKVLRSGKSSFLYSSHVPRPSPHPSIRVEALLSRGGFQGGCWLRSSLLFPVQAPSLLLSARVSLPPSLPPSLPLPRTHPFSLSLPSLSLSLSER